MRNLKKKYKSILLLLVLSGCFPLFIFSQQLSTELYSKLSPSDQNKIKKADELYNKGVQCEEEADKIFEPKKTQLKRLEASEYYQNSASEHSKVLKNNIKSFWKKYSGNKNDLEAVKKLEDAAWDSLKSAKTIREQVEKEGKIENRITLLRKAEKAENNALLRLQKILYVYINFPVHYDEKWIASDSNTIPIAATKIESPKSTTKSPDTTATVNKAIVRDTTATVNKAIVRDTTATVNKTIVQANDSSIYGIVKVNEEQIDQFNEFLKKTYPADVEKYVINFSELDYSDVSQLKDAWYKYQFGNPSGTLLADNNKDTTSESSVATVYQTDSSSHKVSNTRTDKIKSGTNQKEEDTDKYIAISVPDTNKHLENSDSSIEDKKVQDSEKGISSDTKSSQNKEKKVIAGNNTQKSSVINKKESTTRSQEDKQDASGTSVAGKMETSADFIYRVQIAACRIPIDQKVLGDIYNGPEKVVELEEDLWYKYAIGRFSNYKEAHDFAESSKIPGAFVIAYLNGKRIKITPAAVSKNGSSSKESPGTSGEIEFRIQVAASKSQIPERLLKNIYNDIKSLKIISENGWYKYSLTAGSTVDDARALIKTLNIPGAFVIAYQNGVKIDLAEAVKLTSN